ncbi:hypothetical protein ANANG_G00282870 [Anguilla anguilla]|uniref:Uncharacterized protein n=1 Tax=Anguilla anguilla TaxID=7936 RepID=A0A9D3LJ10_ANGAN|nr:hypothetical protein ANANG_G00282870 [Anguilla anguilla]
MMESAQREKEREQEPVSVIMSKRKGGGDIRQFFGQPQKRRKIIHSSRESEFAGESRQAGEDEGAGEEGEEFGPCPTQPNMQIYNQRKNSWDSTKYHQRQSKI